MINRSAVALDHLAQTVRTLTGSAGLKVLGVDQTRRPDGGSEPIVLRIELHYEPHRVAILEINLKVAPDREAHYSDPSCVEIVGRSDLKLLRLSDLTRELVWGAVEPDADKTVHPPAPVTAQSLRRQNNRASWRKRAKATIAHATNKNFVQAKRREGWLRRPILILYHLFRPPMTLYRDGEWHKPSLISRLWAGVGVAMGWDDREHPLHPLYNPHTFSPDR
jgi:hypothetical protein